MTDYSAIGWSVGGIISILLIRKIRQICKRTSPQEGSEEKYKVTGTIEVQPAKKTPQLI